jgi:hypothetical protein
MSTKYKKKYIPKVLRDMVWDTYIGLNLGIGDCYCCKEQINSKNFETGHIESEVKGGKTTLDNLRPVCSRCNKSIGIKNMDTFIEEYDIHKTPRIRKYYNTNCNEFKPIKKSLNYDCDICNKIYSSYSGMWKHKKKIHDNDKKAKIHSCIYCKGIYASSSSLSHHRKKCKQNPSNIKKEDNEDSKISITLIKELFPKLIDTLNNLTEKNSQGQTQNNDAGNDINNINNTNSNNNIIGNLTISLGNENLSEIISKDDQIKILNQKNGFSY